jgi:hypothetical protein
MVDIGYPSLNGMVAWTPGLLSDGLLDTQPWTPSYNPTAFHPVTPYVAIAVNHLALAPFHALLHWKSKKRLASTRKLRRLSCWPASVALWW